MLTHRSKAKQHELLSHISLARSEAERAAKLCWLGSGIRKMRVEAIHDMSDAGVIISIPI